MLLNISKKTKIVCTIGPATSTKEKILDLYKAGMTVIPAPSITVPASVKIPLPIRLITPSFIYISHGLPSLITFFINTVLIVLTSEQAKIIRRI